MMCGHCEAHTVKALEAIDGVEVAEASHTEKKAVVTLTKDVDNEELKKAVEGAGYKVLSIEVMEKKEEGDINMTKTMTINGMMCPHCEKHTVEALEAIDGVEKAVASHVEKNAVVTLSKDVDNEVLKKAVEGAGYEVVDIK